MRRFDNDRSSTKAKFEKILIVVALENQFSDLLAFMSNTCADRRKFCEKLWDNVFLINLRSPSDNSYSNVNKVVKDDESTMKKSVSQVNESREENPIKLQAIKMTG